MLTYIRKKNPWKLQNKEKVYEKKNEEVEWLNRTKNMEEKLEKIKSIINQLREEEEKRDKEKKEYQEKILKEWRKKVLEKERKENERIEKKDLPDKKC